MTTGPNFTADRKIPDAVPFSFGGNQLLIVDVTPIGNGPSARPSPIRHSFIDHSEPNCTSNVLYKNALLGESARTVWIGDVRIRPAATGTDTYEMNRNLLLSDGARADSVPNLEIETGQIRGAGHATSFERPAAFNRVVSDLLDACVVE